MEVLSSIELARWLMIAGAVFIAMGCFGLAFGTNKETSDFEPPAK
jgi:hypothetical protein